MKIFGIGLSNTGTRSLANALTILGYTTIHYPWSIAQISQYDAALDIPVACRFKELDNLFPGSRFILTTRPFKEWLDRRRTKPLDEEDSPAWRIETRIKMYGDSKFNESLYTQAYNQHHQNVYEYFQNRNDLLILPLGDKNKWEKLCEFLQKPIPPQPYPWDGKSIKLF